jgi:hypothetical protein
VGVDSRKLEPTSRSNWEKTSINPLSLLLPTPRDWHKIDHFYDGSTYRAQARYTENVLDIAVDVNPGNYALPDNIEKIMDVMDEAATDMISAVDCRYTKAKHFIEPGLYIRRYTVFPTREAEELSYKPEDFKKGVS